MPHDKAHVLADVHQGGAGRGRARDRRRRARRGTTGTACRGRSAPPIFLRAAELLAGPWRDTLNAATMLGQSKTAHQAEIDAACELIDFLRFNVEFMHADLRGAADLLAGRLEPDGVPPARGLRLRGHAVQLHRDRRATCRARAALMGNTVVWKPASTAMLSAYYVMRLLEEAGLPPGVINLVYGPGAEVGDAALASQRPRRRPLHRLDARLPGHVEDDRREHRRLPELPAHRRRDRRQGLHRRAPVRRRGRARDRDRARLVRVPGPEVLGRLARLRAVEPVAGAARAARRGGRGRSAWATSPTSRTSWAP